MVSGVGACLRLIFPVLALALPSAGFAQAPDSLVADSLAQAADSTQNPVFTVTGLTVQVTRTVVTAGGTAAVDLPLDSLTVVPAPTMEEVLRVMPLVQIRENSRGEAQPAIRGSEERQIAVLVDGVPLTYGWDNRTDMSIIPLTAARNVRLIRGLSSVLHGPNVLGGVIEVDVSRDESPIVRPPPFTMQGGLDQTGSGAVSATAGGLLGEHWVLRGGAGYRNRTAHPISQRLQLDAGDNENLLTDDGTTRLNSDGRLADGFLTARYLSSGGSWLAMSGSGYVTERGVPPEVNEEDPRLWRYPEQSRFLGGVSGGTGDRSTPWGEGDLEASVGFDVQHFAIDEYNTPQYDQITGGETGDTRTLSLRLLGDHTVGKRGQFRSSFTFADVAHEEVLLPEDRQATYRQRLWSLAAEGDWAVGATGNTSLSAGLAVDGADTPESGDKVPVGTLWDWGGRLGVSSLVAEGVLVHGAVSRRTRFPSLRELYSEALGRFLPNPGLGPESLLGGEVGVTLGSGGGELQIVAFHHRIDDGIIRISLETPDGAKRQRVNQSRIRATGLEMLTSGSVGWLDYTADLTIQDVTLLGEEDVEVEAEYQPNVFGKAGFGGYLPWDLYWNAAGRVIGSQYCTTTTADLSAQLDASAAFDLGLRRVFPLGRMGGLSNVDVLAAVDNVADAGYYDQCGLPQPGRRFRVQFRLF